MISLPCHCVTYNPACTRSGNPATLRDWELCSGKCPSERPCTKVQSDAYRFAWDKNFHKNSQNRSLECFHLGDVLDKLDCNCPGKWVRECDKHKRCTLQTSHENLKCCKTCSDFISESPESARKIIFHNGQSPGDCLVMTAAIECLHSQYPGEFMTAVDSPCSAVFENNPHVSKADSSWDKMDMHYPLINKSNQQAKHFMEGYCNYLGQVLKVPIELTVNRPYLYLTNEEKNWASQVQEITKKPTKFWLLNSGTKKDYTAKQWPYYQEVVDILHGRVQFVQVGELNHIHSKIHNTIDLRGKTDLRQLIRLVYHSQGVLSGVSFLMHAAAALEKPAVIIAGGREPKSWNTYPKQTLFSTIGSLPCCNDGGCWKSRTVPLNDGEKHDSSLCERPIYGEIPAPKCMALIHPEEVAAAILRYYDGGILSYS